MNPIDQFRYAFYEKLVTEEKAKEQQQHLKERNCYHRYDIEVNSYLDGYRRWECSKCGRTTLRRANTLKGTNGLDACRIS
jgi:hypothetical protein